MVRDSAEVVQAFPVQVNTYVGTPSGFNAKGFKILHAAADCDVTFDFGVHGVVIMSIVTGQDLAFSDEVQTITATDICWIS